MLNLIRCVAICFVALFLSACTTTGEKRGFSVKTINYEFTCEHEPSETTISDEWLAALPSVAEALKSLIPLVTPTNVTSNNGVQANVNIEHLNSVIAATTNLTNALSQMSNSATDATIKTLTQDCIKIVKGTVSP